MNPTFILYTYQPGATPECHAFAADSQQAAQAEGEKLQAATPTLGFMVLPLEAMPSAAAATQRRQR